MSILELMVAMSIMGVFGSILTAATIQMYRVTSRTESTTTAQTQLNLAFQRLDRQIRYANWVGIPGTVGADRYVEYATDNAGVSVCGQLRLTFVTAQLQWRSWTEGGVPGSWTVLASGVTAGTTPFAITQVGDVDPQTGAITASQTLNVSLSVTDGTETKQLDSTFPAINTVPSQSPSNAAPPVTRCAEGR